MTRKQIAEFLYNSFIGQELEEWDLTHQLSQLCTELENREIDQEEFVDAVTDAFRENRFADTITEQLITEFTEAQQT